MPRFFCLLLVTLSIVALSPSARSQSADFVPLLSGNKYPLTLTLKELDGSWRTMLLTKSFDHDTVAMLTIDRDYRVVYSYYTHGETITVSGEIFLVAYRRILKQQEIDQLRSGGEGSLPSGSPETVLTLSLISLRQIVSLDDIQFYTPPTAQSQEEADKHTTVSNLLQIGLAMTQYIQDYDEQLPPMSSASVTKTVIYPFIKAESTFEKPQTHEMYQPNTSLSHRLMPSFAHPATMVIYYEPSPAPDGKRAVLFLDGHVKRVEEAEWQRLKAASHIPKPAAGVQ